MFCNSCNINNFLSQIVIGYTSINSNYILGRTKTILGSTLDNRIIKLVIMIAGSNTVRRY